MEGLREFINSSVCGESKSTFVAKTARCSRARVARGLPALVRFPNL